MEFNVKGLHFNYDMAESDWMLKRGAKAVGCGVHRKTGNPYVVFRINKRYHELDEEYQALQNER